MKRKNPEQETPQQCQTVACLIEQHQLEPLKPEGGYFRRSFYSSAAVVAPYTSEPRRAGNAIIYLMTEDEFSRIHRLPMDEVWHFYEGGPAEIFEFDAAVEGDCRITTLGRAPGQLLQYTVSAGTWFAAAPQRGSGHSLVGCTPFPAFEYKDFELGIPEQLLRLFPRAANNIQRLTHNPGIHSLATNGSGDAPLEAGKLSLQENGQPVTSSAVCMVTGASSGLGAALVASLARPHMGLCVVACLRSLEKREGLDAVLAATQIQRDAVHIVRMDVRDEESVEAAFKEVESTFGEVEVLVNNAGILVVGTLEMVSLTQAHEVFETNFFGPMRTMQRCLPGMRKRGRGTIVNISSILGEIPTMNQPVYAASKVALDELSLATAGAVRPFGVRVHTVQPGGIKDTAIGGNLQNGDRFSKESNPYPIDEMVAKSVFDRIIPHAQTSAEVADVVCQVVDGTICEAQLQTSDYTQGLAKQKLRDPSGEAMIRLQY